MPPPAKPNYGVDAPQVIMTFVALCFGLTFLGIFVGSGTGRVAAGLAPWWAAAACGVTALWMIRSSKVGKPALWRRTLDALGLQGDEQALDVGCGRGLVLNELAQRLPQGRATGVDIWRGKDQSGNNRAVTELNARLVGVADRVEIVDGDMTDLRFPDASFDLVTASLAIHNVRLAEERTKAMHGIMRVLRPGGRVVIIDIAKTAEYERALREGGFADVERSGLSFSIYPPVRTVTATKPQGEPWS